MKTKNLARICTLVLIIGMMSSIAQALVMPLSVDGFIYELDGYTQVKAGIFFSVENLNSGFYIEGVTGRASNSGKYAVVVEGRSGDTVKITASNG